MRVINYILRTIFGPTYQHRNGRNSVLHSSSHGSVLCPQNTYFVLSESRLVPFGSCCTPFESYSAPSDCHSALFDSHSALSDSYRALFDSRFALFGKFFLDLDIFLLVGCLDSRFHTNNPFGGIHDHSPHTCSCFDKDCVPRIHRSLGTVCSCSVSLGRL